MQMLEMLVAVYTHTCIKLIENNKLNKIGFICNGNER